MTDDIYETRSSTHNFQTELAEQLAELVPEAVADGKIDVLKLQELLSQDAADTSERFGLFWPGKQRALRIAQMPTTATLRPEPEKSQDWDTTKNVFIEGDNLEVLKILQKHYHGKIKLIYIDPPYNTGNDFVYPDNYKEGLENYLEWTRQINVEGKKISTNSEMEGRFHSNWLTMMYPRLKLARNLLSDDGVIFISIDDNEQAHLKKLLDEIFGEQNFVSTFKWNKTSKAPTLSKFVRNKYEYIFAYKKSSALLGLRGVDSYNTAAPLLNNSNQRRTIIFKAGSLGFQFQDCELPAGTYGDADKGVTLENPVAVVDGVNAEQVALTARFKWTQDTTDERMSAGTSVFFKTPKLTTLYYSLDADSGNFIAPSDIINDSEVGVKRNDEAFVSLRDLFSGSVVFDYTKPVSLLKYLIRMIPEDDFYVLDFFAGSGTTAHAVMELNAEDRGKRRFIQVQLPEPTPEDSDAHRIGMETIADISRERVRLAAEKIAKENNMRLDDEEGTLDLGFRSYVLAETSFAKWRIASDVDQNALERHLFSLRGTAADQEEQGTLLVEVLLKQGYSLSEELNEITIAGLNLFSIGDGLVLAYLNEHQKPTIGALQEVIHREPAKFIMLEDAFQGDDELKTNLAQLCKSKNIELWTA